MKTAAATATAIATHQQLRQQLRSSRKTETRVLLVYDCMLQNGHSIILLCAAHARDKQCLLEVASPAADQVIHRKCFSRHQHLHLGLIWCDCCL